MIHWRLVGKFMSYAWFWSQSPETKHQTWIWHGQREWELLTSITWCPKNEQHISQIPWMQQLYMLPKYITYISSTHYQVGMEAVHCLKTSVRVKCFSNLKTWTLQPGTSLFIKDAGRSPDIPFNNRTYHDLLLGVSWSQTYMCSFHTEPRASTVKIWNEHVKVLTSV